MDIFSRRLEFLRRVKGYTKKEMADKLGISQTYYGRFEKGTGQPNLETLVKISEIFDESTDFLVGVANFDSSGLERYKNYSYMKGRYLRALRMMTEGTGDHGILSSEVENLAISLQEYQKNYKDYIELVPYSQYVEPIHDEGGRLSIYKNKRIKEDRA